LTHLLFVRLFTGQSTLHNHTKHLNFGWEVFSLHGIDDFDAVLDATGSLNVKVMADFYVETNKGIICSQDHRSLLGDEDTFDVVLSIRISGNEDVEIGNFFCHTAILSGDVFSLRTTINGKA